MSYYFGRASGCKSVCQSVCRLPGQNQPWRMRAHQTSSCRSVGRSGVVSGEKITGSHCSNYPSIESITVYITLQLLFVGGIILLYCPAYPAKTYQVANVPTTTGFGLACGGVRKQLWRRLLQGRG
jgi:hypothetical protein